MNRNKPILLLLGFLLLIPSIAFSKTITGKTISVEDGDTITIFNNQRRQTKIRLYGIDTPEKRQAFGKKAKKFTASLTAKKHVVVKIYDTDRYGRTVGVVFDGGKNVNDEIIRAGYAWQYRKYCKASFCDDWLRLDAKARSRRVGLWRDKNEVVAYCALGHKLARAAYYIMRDQVEFDEQKLFEVFAICLRIGRGGEPKKGLAKPRDLIGSRLAL